MRVLIFTMMYTICTLAYSYNLDTNYFYQANLFEIIYIYDNKKNIKRKKIRKYKKRLFYIYYNKKEMIKHIIKKYTSFISYNKINVMVSLE